MDAAFTIVTKNYLPQARTLGDSIRGIHPDLPFLILLADETEGQIDLAKEIYPVVEARNIGISAYRDMAFKYDLVEFCTSIKPFCFEYLFANYGYKKIIYFDPDIYVYSRLDVILDLLNEHFVVLTPHLTQPDSAERGTKPDEDFLRCGVFNLGFIALNNSRKGRALLTWWKTKTANKGYADFADGLYVDQKWADLMPCFDDNGVCITRHPGLNVAHWNMHERRLSKDLDGYRVNDHALVFFHFSGFDPLNPDAVTRPHGKGPVSLQGRAAYQELFMAYRGRLLCNQTDCIVLTYAYSKFDNQIPIFSFYRRLYRRLTESGFIYDDPFSTTPQSYYMTLRANRLLISGQRSGGEYRKSDIPNAEGKLKKLTNIMLIIKKAVGIKRYHLLLRTLNTLSRPEEQTFLLETMRLDIPIRFR